MLTLSQILNNLCEANKLCFEGIHYDSGLPVYSGDLWRLWPSKDGIESKKKKRLEELCERKGIALRFSDEIISDTDGKVHEKVIEHHEQTLTFMITEDGDVLSESYLLKNKEEYISILLNDTRKADKWNVNLEQEGFKRFDYVAESGLHHGQSDTPESVREKIQNIHGDVDIVFQIDESSQFYVTFVAFYRSKDYETDD